MGDGASLRVWETGTGALLRALECRGPHNDICSLLTYQRASDGRPRIAAGSHGGQLCIWDGDDFRVLHNVEVSPGGHALRLLAVYEEPTSGRTRLVTG
jgi:WD40 repeat protein